ncbi:MAG: AlpA family phage regulatory protein [Campylobacteraceae bacterium]|jgi:predicted DNA-binding transcriptional regulator AlpA|nr:AlpA family phage regulatory protein [Campylobacteraceae bacterium]
MTEDKFINIKEVLGIVGCKITTWYNLMNSGIAPKPYKPYGTRSARWSYQEIQDWVENSKDNNKGNKEQKIEV